MTKVPKIIFTGALAVVQLAALAIPLAGAAYFLREFGGDNDDGTFTPTAARRWQAALMLAVFLAIWAGQFYATLRALFKMWEKHPDAATEKPDRRPTATAAPGSDRVPKGTSNRDLWQRRRG